MPDRKRHNLTNNRILQRLSGEDWDLLAPDLSDVELPLRKHLESPNTRIEDVYFVGSGYVSVVAKGPRDFIVEVGLIGREGVTGLAVIMGTDRSPHDTFVQGAGTAQRIAAGKLRQAMAQSGALRISLLNYGHAFVTQTGQTAAANACGTIDERLARWLCMAHDRCDGDNVVLTHDLLSMMLGVRRPGVTLALDAMARVGLIEMKRNAILIVDRDSLEQRTHGTYGVPEKEFNRLFG
jgi:CRP-like cAMP-binding protein